MFLTAAFLCSSCRRETEEDKILSTFDAVVRLAENKDLEAVMAYIAEDYRDFEGRDKNGFRSLASSYLAGREGIVIHRLSSRITEVAPGEFSLEADIALSSGRAEALRRLIRISPDVYRLRVDLRKSGSGRQITYGEWGAIGWTDLFPGSLDRLRELFPGSGNEK